MRRLITGFKMDEHGDWVAFLNCGHRQHVRHRPPFEERPWVITEIERSKKIGKPWIVSGVIGSKCRTILKPTGRPPNSTNGLYLRACAGTTRPSPGSGQRSR
ncbi:MAG TPA: DUF3565 domain-containing protein [Candidatus Binatia bacterium]|nr:DUF3565 domain-containing protein [Candidatus Binatia bacterium]